MAEAMLQKAVSLNPDFDRAWIALGGVYEAQGNDQDAIRIYHEALKVNPDGYVHARDAGEYQRLRDQAAMWRETTETVLDRIGLGPGMSALDVGAGPGAVMRLMGDRVGPQGRVTGIEIDPALGAQVAFFRPWRTRPPRSTGQRCVRSPPTSGVPPSSDSRKHIESSRPTS